MVNAMFVVLTVLFWTVSVAATTGGIYLLHIIGSFFAGFSKSNVEPVSWTRLSTFAIIIWLFGLVIFGLLGLLVL